MKAHRHLFIRNIYIVTGMLLLFFKPCKAGAQETHYTYYYWPSISSVVRYDAGIDIDGNVEIDYGMGYEESDYGFETGHYAIDGDDWESANVQGVDYAHDTYLDLWYTDAGTIGAISTEGYSLINFADAHPFSHFLYYPDDYAYDTVNNIWFDETLTDPDTGFWMFTTDPEFEEGTAILGGDTWDYYSISGNKYAHDPILDQWFLNVDTECYNGWQACCAPDLEGSDNLGGEDWYRFDAIDNDTYPSTITSYAYDPIAAQWYETDNSEDLLDVDQYGLDRDDWTTEVAHGYYARIWTPCEAPELTDFDIGGMIGSLDYFYDYVYQVVDDTYVANGSSTWYYSGTINMQNIFRVLAIYQDVVAGDLLP